MELEGIRLSEIRQRKTNHTVSLMWNLRNKTSGQREKREKEIKK